MLGMIAYEIFDTQAKGATADQSSCHGSIIQVFCGFFFFLLFHFQLL